MADFGLSRVLESDATHVSTFTYGERLPHHKKGTCKVSAVMYIFDLATAMFVAHSWPSFCLRLET